jgi:membrane fusion protein, multidrug efflux system
MSNATMSEATVVERDASSADRRSIRKAVGRAIKRLVLALATCGALTAAFWYGHQWWTVGRFVETTDDAYVGGDVTAIAPHVAGFISKVEVSDNGFVKACQLLVTLDDRDMRAALDRAQAILAERRSSLDGLRSRMALQSTIIDAAAADLAAKRAQSSFAVSDAARYTSFGNSNAVTKQETEKAVSLGAAARASVASAEASLAGARQQMVVLKAQIAEAEAHVGEAEADVAAAKLNLGYTQLRAPVAGFVGNRAARVGAYVTVGSYLLTVVPAKGLWVDANFKEDQLAHMKVGDTADVVADVAPDVTMHGHIASLAPGTGGVFSVIPPENATGNFTKIVQRVPVRIVLDGDDGALGVLRPGLSTTVSVDTKQSRR